MPTEAPAPPSASPIRDLYMQDEPAWREAMSQFAAQRLVDELDYANLSEYLEDMAISDRRAVESRLEVLIQHWLKWESQPEKRSASWSKTIDVQTVALTKSFGRRTLRNHAESILPEAYATGRRWASIETGLPIEHFPSECPWNLETLMGEDAQSSRE